MPCIFYTIKDSDRKKKEFWNMQKYILHSVQLEKFVPV